MKIPPEIMRRYDVIEDYYVQLMENTPGRFRGNNKEVVIDNIATNLSHLFVRNQLHLITNIQEERDNQELINKYKSVFKYMYRTKICIHIENLDKQ